VSFRQRRQQFGDADFEVNTLNDLAKNIVLWVVIAVVLATVVSNFSGRGVAF